MCLLVNGPAYMSIGKSIGLAYVKMMTQKKISFVDQKKKDIFFISYFKKDILTKKKRYLFLFLKSLVEWENGITININNIMTLNVYHNWKDIISVKYYYHNYTLSSFVSLFITFFLTIY